MTLIEAIYNMVVDTFVGYENLPSFLMGESLAIILTWGIFFIIVILLYKFLVILLTFGTKL